MILNDVRDDSIIMFVGPKYFKSTLDNDVIMISSCYNDDSDDGRESALLSIALESDVKRYETEGFTPKMYDLNMSSENASRIVCSFMRSGYTLFKDKTRVIVRFVEKIGDKFVAVDAPEGFVDGEFIDPVVKTLTFNKK